MADYYDSEALGTLIKAVQEYKNDLETNYTILLNAANVCDVAMGSDQLSQRHISELNEALKELKKVAQIAEDVAKELIATKNDADDI